MYCKNCGHLVVEGTKFCKNCGAIIIYKLSFTQKVRRFFSSWKNLVILGGALVVFAILAIGLSSSGNSPEASDAPSISKADSSTLASFVVNILCPTDNGSDGGSGTIMDAEGYVLTNNHIIPEDRAGEPVVDECLVTLADSQGKVKNIYEGTPVVIPKLSDEYDLAFIKINKSFTDKDGETWGQYPTHFPNATDSGCFNSDPKL